MNRPRALRMLIIFLLCFQFASNVSSREIDPLDAVSWQSDLTNLGYSAMRVARFLSMSNDLIFLGHHRMSDDNFSPESAEVFKYNLSTRKIEVLIPKAELKAVIPADRVQRVVEILPNRDLKLIVFNIETPTNHDDKMAGEGVGTEMIVYDLTTHRPVYANFDKRYHTHLSISGDSRYLACYSNPDSYLNQANFENIPMNRSEVIDLKTLKPVTIADECDLLLPSCAGFVWAQDSKALLFPHYIKKDNQYTLMISKWSPESGKRKDFPLIGKCKFIGFFELLPNGKTVLGTNREILELDEDFGKENVLYAGAGIHGYHLAGNQINFNENHGKGGWGDKKSISIK